MRPCSPLTATPLTPVGSAPVGSSGPAVPAVPAGTDEETAIADLAAREGVDPASITTVSVENVTWRNSSIGCPEPGMNYMQSLVDGVRVVRHDAEAPSVATVREVGGRCLRVQDAEGTAATIAGTVTPFGNNATLARGDVPQRENQA